MTFAAGGLLIVTAAAILGIDLGASAEPARSARAHWTATATTAEVRLGVSGSW